MAFYRYSLIVNKIHKSFNLTYLLLRQTSKSSRRDVHQNDTLDLYTDNLLQDTSTKWNDFIMKLFLKNTSLRVNIKSSCENNDLISVTENEIQQKIIDCLRESEFSNVVFLINVCQERSYRLDSAFHLYLIRLFAKLGNKESVETLLLLYKINYSKDYEKLNYLQYYRAQVLWYNGKVEDSFQILENFYRDNLSLKEVNCIMYDIIISSIERKELYLVLITKFVQTIVDKYKHYYPVCVLWRKLCESEYFADNQLAKQIISDNMHLVNVIYPLIPVWSLQLIKCHKIDAVYRLSEILLENNCMEFYSSVLHSLFDYYYYQNNLKRCSAVVKSAIDLQIPLKESYQKRFIVLLTTGKPDVSRKTSTIPKRIEYQINLKF